MAGTYFEYLLHELLLLVLDFVVDEHQHLNESAGRHVALRGNVHQEVHDLVVKLDLAHRVQELLLPLFVHSLVHEELLRDVLEEHDRVVVVALMLASVVDAIHQADVLLLRDFDVDHIFEDLQRVRLRELLQNKSGLLLVLT